MNALTLRKLHAADLLILQALGRQTFFETFAESNTEENMQNYLDGGFSEAKLLGELNDPHSEFYLAEENGRAIGYLKVNECGAQTELQQENSLEIERIYVLKEFHGKKVAQLLYEIALTCARAKKKDFIWLGVWEKNPRAIRFYQKNGFVEFDKHIFRLGDDEQTDILMKLKINNFMDAK